MNNSRHRIAIIGQASERDIQAIQEYIESCTGAEMEYYSLHRR